MDLDVKKLNILACYFLNTTTVSKKKKDFSPSFFLQLIPLSHYRYNKALRLLKAHLL